MNNNDDIFNRLKSITPPKPDPLKKQTAIDLARQSFDSQYKCQENEKFNQNKNMPTTKMVQVYYRLKQSIGNFFHSGWKMGTAFASICAILFLGYFSNYLLNFQHEPYDLPAIIDAPQNYDTMQADEPVSAAIVTAPAQTLGKDEVAIVSNDTKLNKELKRQKLPADLAEAKIESKATIVELSNDASAFQDDTQKPLLNEEAIIENERNNISKNSNVISQEVILSETKVNSFNNSDYIHLNAIIAMTKATLGKISFNK